MTQFEPELVQSIKGDLFEEYEAPYILIAAIGYLSYEIDRVMWNINQKEHHNLAYDRDFQESFETETFFMSQYCWCDGNNPGHEEGCPPNFLYKPTGFTLRWYKHLDRGDSMDRPVTGNEISAMLDACLFSVKVLESSYLHYLNKWDNTIHIDGVVPPSY